MIFLDTCQKHFRKGLQTVVIIAVAATCLTSAFAAEAAPAIDFARQVRPILAKNCFQCHGPDEEHREADVRFDTQAGLTDADHAAFVPGKPAESEALTRITSSDPDEQMPPPKTGNQLTAEEIKLLKDWVAQGAKWSNHWSFDRPTASPIPAVKNVDWSQTAIDPFVLRRLQAEGLSPSPPAKRAIWLRRVSLDLIGLPPTPAEVAAFVSDDSPTAEATVVDRLLASPHYGERWGRHWLDAARYADSDGFEKDKPRIVWPYRDWVVNAFNRDLPYNDFIIQQIAGDLLATDETNLQVRQDLITATGFLRNSMINEEGGVHPEQFRMEAMFDRMDAVGKAVLGLTINCAQCHSHKYDPLTQTEYYQLFAFLNDSDEGSAVVYSQAGNEQRAKLYQQIRQLETDLKTEHPDWATRMETWGKQVQSREQLWEVAEIEHIGDNAQRYLHQEDGSLLAQGYAPTKFEATFRTTSRLPEIRSFRLEAITDPNLPAGGPGRSIDGLFALSEFRVEVASATEPNKKTTVKLVAAKATYANEEQTLPARFGDRKGKRGITGPIAFAIDGNNETAWGINAGPGRRNASQSAIFVAEKNVAFPEGTIIDFKLAQRHGGWNSDDNQTMNLGRFRISLSPSADAAVDQADSNVRNILRKSPDSRTADEQLRAFRAFRKTQAAWQKTNEQIEALWQSHPEGTTQLVLHQTSQSRTTSLLERGDYLSPLNQVQPNTPAFLHPLPAANAASESNDAVADRLMFARWLVDERSPTTARAIVNRVWQEYFGTGLTRTSEDLGSQSEEPSHPEMLDWLAVNFMQNGWSLKWLHRQIALSATYRQSSRVSPALIERDPANRLLARGPRFRVDGEIVRDIVLSVSGLLQSEMGGPSVYPPAPRFLFVPPASYGPKTWETDSGADRYRRSLYTFRFRSTPYPSLSVFDTPAGEAACIRRPRSNTPLQALATLNEPIFFEAARSLAHMVQREAHESEADAVASAFRRCLARDATEAEIRILVEHLANQRQDFAKEAERARQFAGDGASLFENLAEAAAWTDLCRVLLNLDETITKE